MGSIPASKLEGFRSWLEADGRSSGTADLYVMNVRNCALDERGMTGRLTSGELAPNTLHTNLAALRAYATYTDDTDLLMRCKRIRLPAARRVKPKVPFEEPQWVALVFAIRAEPGLRDAVRAALEIIAVRGLRCGDVARLTRRQVANAVKVGTLSFMAKGRRQTEYDVAPIRGPLEVLRACGGDWDRVEDLIVTRRARSARARRKVATQLLSRTLGRIALRVQIADTHPHRLRRTYATGYLKRMHGDPQALTKLQRHMGWASPMTALQYVDAVDKGELDARGRDMVDDLFSTAPKKR